jgi:Protein of unknown function (DUF2752)
VRRADRWQRIQLPVLLAGGILGVSVLLHLRDPHRSGSWGYCPWLLLTGTYCPACGSLRAVNDLTRGDVVAAASSNLILVGAVPVFAVWWLRSLVDGWRGTPGRRPARHQRVLAVAAVTVAVAFTVLRNTPAGAWLAP